MPRGHPDYRIYERPAIAEQAVWQDNFEGPRLGWDASGAAGGSVPVLSQTVFWKGSQSVYLLSPVAAAPHSMIQREFPLVKRGRIGIEFFIQAKVYSPGWFRAVLYVYDGVNGSEVDLDYDTVAETIQILTPAGRPIVATKVFMDEDNFYFLPIKLVVDTDTDKYVKLIVGPDTYDLTQYSMFDLGVHAEKELWVSFDVRGCAVVDMWAYIDSFILTQNEP